MSKKKSKYIKVGAVLKGEYGPYIILGNSKAKDPQYNYEVEVIVRNAEGKVVKTLKNGILSTLNPRKRPGITEEEIEKIPEKVMSEVFIVEKGE